MIQKALVLFHSVYGNTFHLARHYAQTLTALNIEADCYRIDDGDGFRSALLSEGQKALLAEVPVLLSPQRLGDYDAIFLGSPTYFANVSAAMKAFMDSCSSLWPEAVLAGKLFSAFTTASTYQGGGLMTLNALNTFAQHMGMTLLSVPSTICGTPQPAYGIIHICGAGGKQYPDEQTLLAISDFLEKSLMPKKEQGRA